MSWLTDIGTFLQTNSVGTVGTDIFFDQIEDGNCIGLFSQGGFKTKTTLRKTMTLERPELGIRVKNFTKSTANTKAESIYNLLDLTFNTTMGSTRFKSIKALSPPFPILQSKTEGYIYSINFSIEIG